VGTPTFGCLVLATGLVRDPARAQMVDAHLEPLVATAALLGASPIVVVHDGTPRVLPPARALHLPRLEQDALSAARLGLMQFTNAPIQIALLIPIDRHDAPAMLLRQLVEGVGTGAAIAACGADVAGVPGGARRGAAGYPIAIARDYWRDLMTHQGSLDDFLATTAIPVRLVAP